MLEQFSLPVRGKIRQISGFQYVKIHTYNVLVSGHSQVGPMETTSLAKDCPANKDSGKLMYCVRHLISNYIGDSQGPDVSYFCFLL